MELHQVRYFLAACETLNFTRAAEAKNVSQPALTKAIHMLEDELGGALFNTQSRPIRLTTFGELLRDRFAQIDDLLGDIKSVSSRFHKLEDSSFTLGVVNTIGNDRFIDIVGRLQEQLLGVSIVIHYVSQGQLVERLKIGEIELAVITEFPNNSALLTAHTLYTEGYVLAVPPDHHFYDREGVRFAELSDEGYVERMHCERVDYMREAMSNAEVNVKCHLSTDQDDFVKLMVESGLGLAILPEALVTPPLRAVPLSDIEVTRDVRLVCRKDRALSPIATKVRDAMMSIEAI